MALNGLLDIIQTQSYDCLILTHPSIRVLTSALEKVQQHFSYSTLNLGASLSKELIHMGLGQRGGIAQVMLEIIIRESQSATVLCFGIDLLFEPSLQIDPLMVFRRASRIKRVIVFWPGSYQESVLAYAETGHQHYRTWRISADWTSSPILRIYPLVDSTN
jgi:hypothetical protein